LSLAGALRRRHRLLSTDLALSGCRHAPPPDLKLATGLFVLLMLALPALKSRQRSAPVHETIRG
jgi:MYXO-CTERM domain-containing protein